jgi:hypothetical protein
MPEKQPRFRQQAYHVSGEDRTSIHEMQNVIRGLRLELLVLARIVEQMSEENSGDDVKSE